MTVSTTTAKSRYDGDGMTADFPTGFKFLDNGQVQVILRAADGSETLWSEGSEYSLSGAGAPGGGTVTVAATPVDHRPAPGETLVIRLAVPPRQETSLPLGGAFPSTVVETMADLAVLRDQEIHEMLSRVPRMKRSTAAADIDFPEPAAGQLIAWNAAGTGLENAAPPADGADGRTILSGAGAPAAATGQDGDVYLDTSAFALYGPKAGGGWGTAVSLVGPLGPQGEPGPVGAAGADGADGRSLLSGSGAPGGGLGSDGDFYIDTLAAALYGPKTGGSWGGATGLVGPQGPAGPAGPAGSDGADGADGADGQGVPPGGLAGAVLAKVSGADHDTAWVAAGLASLAEDAAPQLGGALDGQGNTVEDVALKVVPAKTASFTFAAAEAGVLTPCNAAAAMTATVPPEATVAFAPGTTLAIWQQGAGAVTWVAGSGVTLQRDASLTLQSSGQHAVSLAIKVASDTWVVAGGLEPV